MDTQRDPLAALKIDRNDRAERSRTAQRSGGNRGIKWFGGLVLLLGFLGGGYYYVNNYQASGEFVPEMIRSRPEVRVARVETQRGRSGDATVVATGYLESRRQAKIGARAPGRIQVIDVEEGTPVTANQVLAVLEHADLDAALLATRASVVRAQAALGEQRITVAHLERELARAKKLRAANSLSELELDQAKFEYDGAVAKLDSLDAEIALAEARAAEAEQLKENMFVRAPFAGTVISKDAEVGESILPGGMGEASGRGSVVTIADLAHLEVECDVKEDYIGRISELQAAEVAVDAVPDRRYKGQVRKIIPMGDRARATIKVRVEILDSDGRLFPDMSGRVFFLPAQTAESEPNADKPRYFCPTQALVGVAPSGAAGKSSTPEPTATPAEPIPRLNQDAQGEVYVWVVDSESRVHRRAVKTGATRDRVTEVTEGLSGSERVVVNPPELTEGQLVKVAQE